MRISTDWVNIIRTDHQRLLRTVKYEQELDTSDPYDEYAATDPFMMKKDFVDFHKVSQIFV